MGYFKSGEEVAEEIGAALELFLSSGEGQAAAKAAGESIGPNAALELRMTEPAATVRLVLGSEPRVEHGPSNAVAPIEVVIDADTMHDLMVDHLGAGHIARAIELGQINVSGSPHALDAMIVMAGSLDGCYQRSLEARGRHDLLATPVPPPPGDWKIDVVGPELFMRDVVGVRHKRNERESRGGQGDPDRPPVHP